MLSVSSASHILGVSPSRVRALISAGQLPAQKIGKSWVIEEEAVVRRAQSKPKAGRSAESSDAVSVHSKTPSAPSKEFSAFYRMAKEQFSHYPSATEMGNFSSREERSFAIAVADFFLQQRQREAIEQGVF